MTEQDIVERLTDARDSYVPIPWEYSPKPMPTWQESLDEFEQKIIDVKALLDKQNG